MVILLLWNVVVRNYDYVYLFNFIIIVLMDIGDIRYNPLTDVSEVDQFGFVDLNDAFRNGTVMGDLAPTEEDYNGIDKASDVGAKPRDSFEAIELGRSALKAGQVKSDQPSSGK